MDDHRRDERGAGLRHAQRRPLGEQREHDELQPDQRARGRADDDVEALPFRKLCHDDPR